MDKIIRIGVQALAITVSLGAPLLAFAQLPPSVYNTAGSSGGTVQSLGITIISIINGTAVPLVFGVAFIVFLYGVYKYFILGAENEDDREKGKQLILWGLIGFVVMISIWGLVIAVMRTFGLTASNAPPPPTI